jgi:hypothetical protein
MLSRDNDSGFDWKAGDGMKFRAIGSNQQTGARMILEFEADSKAAAERKASQSGMSVNRVEPINSGAPVADEPVPRGRENSFGLLVRFLILIGIAAFIFWWIYFKGKPLQLPGR